MFDSEVAELEFLLKHPFCGAAPDGETIEGEQGGDQGSAEGDQANKGGDADPGDKGDKTPPKDGQWIPKHRFDEVNQGFTKYKEFGSPDDIRKGLNRLKELEALPQNRTTDKEKAEIRKELLQVFPELSVMTNMLEIQKEAYTERGAEQNNEFLKELGIEVSESTNRYLQELISGVIASDKTLLRRFYAMDDKVFKAAFDIAKKTFWPNSRKPVPGANLQNKKILPKAPSTQKLAEEKKKPEGNGQLGRLEERAVLDEASEQAFAMLEQSRSE